jgi:hypothetical protein
MRPYFPIDAILVAGLVGIGFMLSACGNKTDEAEEETAKLVKTVVIGSAATGGTASGKVTR